MSRYLFIKGTKSNNYVLPPPDPALSLRGKVVTFKHKGETLLGLVDSAPGDFAGGEVFVRLGVPAPDGLLTISDSMVKKQLSELAPRDLPFEKRKVLLAQWQEEVAYDGKATVIRGEANRVVDYQDVVFTGYASTFKHVTESDRQGDAVMPGAFAATIAAFKRNPVMLMDHYNSVQHVAGHFTDVKEDARGLFVTGKVSNAPDLTTMRFHLVEGSVRTLSIGGVFLYQPDGRTIDKVFLFEISLVAVPANPDAIIQTRALDEAGAVKMFARHKAAITVPHQ